MFGGAGLDILIGNTGGDRLIDWVGEFNSYIVPFAPFGIATVSRQVPPALFEFLYALSKAQGADPTRAADEGDSVSAARNGEPNGEIGLITQKDHGLWQEQTGSPTDPQAGQHPGRQARRAAHGELQRRHADRLRARQRRRGRSRPARCTVAAASLGKDAAAVFYVDQTLPVYYELLAQVLVQKPTAGWNANAYVIFDYFSPTDFKFAGIDVALNKAVLGHRTAQGWVVDADRRRHRRRQVRHLLRPAGRRERPRRHRARQRRRACSHAVAPRYIDGQAFGLNLGLVGVGSNNSRGTFDNFTVQALPPQSSFENTEDFADGAADLFTGDRTGTWTVTGGRYTGTPRRDAAGDERDDACRRARPATPRSISTRPSGSSSRRLRRLRLRLLRADATSSTSTLDLAARPVVVGHRIRNQWVDGRDLRGRARRRRRLQARARPQRHHRHRHAERRAARLVLLLRRRRRRRPRDDQPHRHDVLRQRARGHRHATSNLARQRSRRR